VWLYVVARRNASGDEYRAKARVDPGGRVYFGMSRFVAGVETPIAPMVEIPGLNAVAGQWIRFRARGTGAGVTTWQMRAWSLPSAEPLTWQLLVSDSTPSLQFAGTFGLRSYASSTLTNLPLTMLVDDFVVTAIKP
jgi:hypothetical protein